jgi:hypothetical protein
MVSAPGVPPDDAVQAARVRTITETGRMRSLESALRNVLGRAFKIKQ